jgi:hypothetical protein
MIQSRTKIFSYPSLKNVRHDISNSGNITLRSILAQLGRN